MLNDLMKWCNDNPILCVGLILLTLHVFEMLNPLLKCFGIEPFDNPSDISASEQLGQNEVFQPVENLGRTPSSCYPQQTLKPEDLLPTEESTAIQEFNATPPAKHKFLTLYSSAKFFTILKTISSVTA